MTDFDSFDESPDYRVAGLDSPVEILIDTWGVPHIYADSQDDLFFAQGFNAARDRLFQIDVWRRRGLGLLAEVLGGAYVEQDRANRLLQYRGDLSEEWQSYGVDAQRIVRRFVDGINAYVHWCLSHPEALPPEFAVHDFLPSLWNPEDVVRFRTHGLLYNAEQELARAHTIATLGAEAEALRQSREPESDLVMPDGLVLSDLSPTVLAVYRLAFAPVTFAGTPAIASASAESISGSNNWVVAPERTDTGRGILANDPHRAVTLPSLRYMAHLSAPGLDVIGAGEPGLPGVSIGHNEKVAFGLTIWPADVEDLYVYRLHDERADTYRYGNDWRAFSVITEEIPVRGGAPVEVELRYSQHGPVLEVDADRGTAVALRAAWLEPGMTPYLGSLSYLDAADADQFVDALQYWGTPAVNQIYADVDGRWGWQTSAKAPRRPNWDGSLPVPGDGRYEWRGLAGAAELPGIREPASGWFASANEMNWPASGQDIQPVTHDWFAPDRYQRMRSWLADDERVSIARSDEMQFDFVNAGAARLMRLLAPVPIDSVVLRSQFDRLLAWDGLETVESWEAAVFEVWWRRHFRPRLFEHHLKTKGVDVDPTDPAFLRLSKDEYGMAGFRGELRALASIDFESSAEIDQLTAVVNDSLRTAFAELAALLGPDEQQWTWGRLHHVLLENVALATADVPAEWKRLGPVPRAGSSETLGLTAYDPTFRQFMGSTFRMVLDIGDWDKSVAINAPGQSGDPRSAHYSDAFDPWLNGESFPLLFSRQAIERNCGIRLTLNPISKAVDRS